jgi:hypothetical protein
LHVAASELLMRQPGIVALHAVTTTNALGFAYQTSGNDETRRLLLLQNAAFVPMFRDAMGGRGGIKKLSIEDLSADDAERKDVTIDQIFADVRREPMNASRNLVAYLNRPSADATSAKEVVDAARMLVFLKGNDPHDYKFSSAIFEDYRLVSPKWRNQYLAANTFMLPSSEDADNSLVERTRAALNS